MEQKDLLRILGKRVRRLRKERGCSQRELAERARVSQDFLGRAKRGDREPSLFVLLKLATVLGVAPALLLTPLSAHRDPQLEATSELLAGRTPSEISWVSDLIRFVLEQPPLALAESPTTRGALPLKYGRASRHVSTTLRHLVREFGVDHLRSPRG